MIGRMILIKNVYTERPVISHAAPLEPNFIGYLFLQTRRSYGAVQT
jgi:hypothetical protein